MKKSILIFLILINFKIYSQTESEYLKSGIEKFKNKEYEKAIEDYTNAIKLNPNFSIAYYNIGLSYNFLNKSDLALQNFDKAIELNSKFVEAYYNRATIFANSNRFDQSLFELDKVIELDSKFPNALTLRGQIRVQKGRRKDACDDFQLAKSNGDSQADYYIKENCTKDFYKQEAFLLDWPDEEKWKLGANQKNSKIAMMDFIHEDETLENWTELGNMTVYYDVKGVSVDKLMNILYESAKVKSPDAKLTFLEKNEETKNPWILFKIENPLITDRNHPESQLWYVVLGEITVYSNFRAIKKASLPDDLVEKWSKMLKKGQVVIRDN